MTDQEMTRLFSVMLLAWPNAPMFQGGIEKLGPTIRLWRVCLSDVDFLTGQMAVLRLCRTCKFPPSIAETRAAADEIRAEMKRETDEAYFWLRTQVDLCGDDLSGAYRRLPERTRKAIDLMGGTGQILSDDGRMFNLYGFQTAYRRVLTDAMRDTVRTLTGTVKTQSVRLGPHTQ